MWNEFKEFALKGNALSLAIGVIIGAAFGKIVDALVNDIIMPIIGIAGKADFTNYFVPLSSAVTATNLEDARKQGGVFAYGDFITVVDQLRHRRPRAIRRDQGDQHADPAGRQRAAGSSSADPGSRPAHPDPRPARQALNARVGAQEAARPNAGGYLAFFSSQAFICAISFSCAAMMSVASCRNSGSVPYWSSTFAISIAP